MVPGDRMPKSLPPRSRTIRAALEQALLEGPFDARELSQRVGVSEREVEQHLEHVERSLAGRGQELAIDPARCLDCDFVFEKRTRIRRPGRCPRCKSTRVTRPRFSLG